MKKLLKMGAGMFVLGGLAFGAFMFVPGDAAGKEEAFTLVEVETGTIVDKALGTGQIVPELEIQVKSQISGIIRICFVQVGDVVKQGDELFEITPDPTPLELTEGERNVELAEVAYRRVKIDLDRSQRLLDGGILARDKYDSVRETHDQARIQLDLASERLTLLREGRIIKENGGVDSIIRATTAGTVLERLVDPGDPVVPLTNFQAGTPLMTLADMGNLLFKGTVDEIDVGKLSEGMQARIQIGALPEVTITGSLMRIAPKAKEEEGATLFDVEVAIEDSGGAVLRAGYSANADIIIQEKKDVLLVPERLIQFEDEKTFIELPPELPDGEPVRHEIEVGLSDGLNVEVVAGLTADTKLVQRPPRQVQ